jgi:ABC-2 type transport system ATP-binding protein
MDSTSGINIENISYAYGETVALEDVSLAVDPGRFTALLGPNGAGKSTLVALLTGLFVPDAGQIAILDRDIASQPGEALARMGIVFQAQTLELDLSVHQNMRYFAALHGISNRAVGERVDTCLARMGLSERGGERVRNLNSGHRRRLEIARALLHRPRVLLLDEPTVGLDVPSRSAIVEHVHEICRDEAITVLWATHLVDEVWPEDRVAVLHRGRIKGSGSVTEILDLTGAADVLQAFKQLTDPNGDPAHAQP